MDILSQIANLQSRISDGENIPDEELREAYRALREDRQSFRPKPAKVKSAPVDGDKEIDDLFA
jgi:hypothetical protein